MSEPLHDADSHANGGAEAVSTLSWTHTVGAGSNRLLVVGIGTRSGTVGASGVKYNGVPLTRAKKEETGSVAEIWYLLAPPEGAHSVGVSLSAGARLAAGASSFFNVNQSTPIGTPEGAHAESAEAAVTVSSAEEEMVVGVLSCPNSATTFTPGEGQTLNWEEVTTNATTSSNVKAASSRKAGATSVTLKWTLSVKRAWAMAAVSIEGAPVSGEPPLVIFGAGQWQPAQLERLGAGGWAPARIEAVVS